MSKASRQHLISQLLAEHSVKSQQALVDLLKKKGHTTTKATVSRDLDDLGAVKVRVSGGATVYAIPDVVFDRVSPLDHLQKVLGDWVASVSSSDNVVVLRTPPGSAHVVASALDRGGLEEILGTVAGDDTLLVIAAEGHTGAEIADKLKKLAGLD